MLFFTLFFTKHRWPREPRQSRSDGRGVSGEERIHLSPMAVFVHRRESHSSVFRVYVA